MGLQAILKWMDWFIIFIGFCKWKYENPLEMISPQCFAPFTTRCKVQPIDTCAIWASVPSTGKSLSEALLFVEIGGSCCVQNCAKWCILSNMLHLAVIFTEMSENILFNAL